MYIPFFTLPPSQTFVYIRISLAGRQTLKVDLKSTRTFCLCLLIVNCLLLARVPRVSIYTYYILDFNIYKYTLIYMYNCTYTVEYTTLNVSHRARCACVICIFTNYIHSWNAQTEKESSSPWIFSTNFYIHRTFLYICSCIKSSTCVYLYKMYIYYFFFFFTFIRCLFSFFFSPGDFAALEFTSLVTAHTSITQEVPASKRVPIF